MGSLIPGWNSRVLDSKSAKLERNWSLTKEEINAYRRSRKRNEEEHLRDTSLSPDAGKIYQRSNSMPSSDQVNDEFMRMDAEENLEKLINTRAWWRRSNCAFLNEPPVISTETGNRKSNAAPFDNVPSKTVT